MAIATERPRRATATETRRRRLWTLVTAIEVAAASAAVALDLLVPTIVLLLMAGLSLICRREGLASLGLRRTGQPHLAVKMLTFAAAWSLVQVALIMPITNHLSGREQDLSGFDNLQGNLALLAALLILSWTLAALGEELAYPRLICRLACGNSSATRGRAVPVAVLASSMLFGIADSEQGLVGIIAVTLDAIAFQRRALPLQDTLGSRPRSRIQQHDRFHRLLPGRTHPRTLVAAARPRMTFGPSGGAGSRGPLRHRHLRGSMMIETQTRPDDQSRPRTRTRLLIAAAVALVVAVLAIAIAIAAAFDDDSSHTERGSGVAITEDRNVSSFASVEVAGDNDVMIHVGSPQAVAVTADDNLVDRVTTTVRDGRLVIDNVGSFTTTAPMQVVASVPSLDEVELSGTGSITISGMAEDEVVATLSGTGTLAASGTSARLTAVLAGSGRLDLHDLVAGDVTARLDGTGEIRVHATSTLDATLIGTGTIRYSGEPAVTSRNAGTGTITPA